MDWNNGKAGTSSVMLIVDTKYDDTKFLIVIGENESEIMKMIGELPKESG